MLKHRNLKTEKLSLLENGDEAALDGGILVQHVSDQAQIHALMVTTAHGFHSLLNIVRWPKTETFGNSAFLHHPL